MVGKILILGDQNKQGQELKEALKKETHFTLRQSSLNGIAASEIGEYEADLVILNPKGGYVEVIDLYYGLKKDAQTQDVPIVLMMDETEMRSADLPSGIQDVLYRPIRPSEAVARVKFLFKKLHRVDQKNLIQHGKLVIDIEKYEVRISDKKIDLTYTEFELLKFLCSNPGTSSRWTTRGSRRRRGRFSRISGAWRRRLRRPWRAWPRRSSAGSSRTATTARR
jgi:DNA-binding response OmpR family regulator